MVVPNGNGHEGDPPSIAGMVPGNTRGIGSHAPVAPRCPRRSRRAVDDAAGVAAGQCGHRDSTEPHLQGNKHPPCAPSPDVTPSAPSSRSSTRPPRRSSRSRFLSNAGLGVIDLDLPGAAPFILLSAMSLVAAAFITTALADGRSRRPRAAQPGVPVPGQPALVPRRLRRPARGGPRRGLRPRRCRPGRHARDRSVHRPQRRRRRGHRLRAHQLVGRGRLDRLRAPSPPGPHGPGPRQRRHDLDAGRAPPAPRVHRRRRHHRPRRPGEHPVLPRRAVRPADPGPHDADLDLQLERPQRPDRGPVPRGPRRRRRGGVPAPHRTERRSGHGLRGLRGPRSDRARRDPRPAGTAGRPRPRRSSARRWWPPRPDLSPSEPGGPSGSPGSFRSPVGRPGASSRRGRTSRTASRSWPPPAPAGRRRWPSGPGPCPSRRSRATSARRGTASRHRPGCRPRRRATS